MSMPKRFRPERALLFVATLFSEDEVYRRAREDLVRTFGEASLESECLPWVHSDYYRDELGWPIKRRFLGFSEGFSTESIREAKLLTMELEKRFSVEGRRRINLDPGYVTEAKVVLATTKNYPHRIYLGSGIYAEVTLHYRRGAYRPHEFTYRDYGTPEYLGIFHEMRNILRESIPLPPPSRP